jgi:hypothetical protein
MANLTYSFKQLWARRFFHYYLRDQTVMNQTIEQLLLKRILVLYGAMGKHQ